MKICKRNALNCGKRLVYRDLAPGEVFRWCRPDDRYYDERQPPLTRARCYSEYPQMKLNNDAYAGIQLGGYNAIQHESWYDWPVERVNGYFVEEA